MTKHSMSRCRVCENYLHGAEVCKYCHFEWSIKYPACNDNWDILDLEEEYEHGHLQLMDRLFSNNIECLYADMWCDDSIAFILGCNAKTYDIAKAFGVSENSVYNDYEHSFVIINLYQEKFIRRFGSEVSCDNLDEYLPSVAWKKSNDDFMYQIRRALKENLSVEELAENCGIYLEQYCE